MPTLSAGATAPEQVAGSADPTDATFARGASGHSCSGSAVSSWSASPTVAEEPRGAAGSAHAAVAGDAVGHRGAHPTHSSASAGSAVAEQPGGAAGAAHPGSVWWLFTNVLPGLLSR
ncbi:hypothetical protein C3475_16800 [Mycobacterium kansasii]|nr:hypothetical protein C3475_16800 [Mycobacterium kansasii]VAZ63813.1 hypothetical protein LAUMK22_05655 [Mycobacterium kansasii]